MLEGPREQPGILLLAAVPRFVHHTRRMFVRINIVVASFPTTADIILDLVQQCLELVLVVEGCHRDLSPFVPLGVIPIVLHDVTENAVVLGVNPCHGSRIGFVAHRLNG